MEEAEIERWEVIGAYDPGSEVVSLDIGEGDGGDASNLSSPSSPSIDVAPPSRVRLKIRQVINQSREEVASGVVWNVAVELCWFLWRELGHGCKWKAPESFAFVELGAGTGVVGLFLKCCFASASVLLTDLPDALGLLRGNIELNGLEGQEAVSSGGEAQICCRGKLEVMALDWREPGGKVRELLEKDNGWSCLKIAVGADLTYSPECRQLLSEILKDDSHPLSQIPWLIAHQHRDPISISEEEIFRIFGPLCSRILVASQDRTSRFKSDVGSFGFFLFFPKGCPAAFPEETAALLSLLEPAFTRAHSNHHGAASGD
uniref:FAM86 N-terminal domain-containing protein n=1 Tax=Chromera velia CCMP2878 TaxID=1169474 RepID=A0A0G4FW54_9ALVE|mmetsp:Transcript_30975/g.61079  ORF Transcript_30975/g.61079 Transcript_30975/m.61079 type:complete len:317 (+) Transcript_30975:190-1140(+)|eukprot:Cvel_19023.t1-p1 / transcript=Cvel_19023.t1 / gene=Cvel_19023 / organism=Chromera_velia_CCMP2878 / gene_product=hypothetical protein / transcript_product=hypothetical protein / location=Cvel_scaffold1611:6423-8382(+) / protein_length=316 / sequence_SO=supercontig / SO=protein_coding / is_pseudo=false